jgi:hypothetical protein
MPVALPIPINWRVNKKPTFNGQRNEALCKVICHNICYLIQAINEFGCKGVKVLIKWTSQLKGVIFSVRTEVLNGH